MNIRINLLPWRDEQRRQAKKRGKILLVIAFVIGLAIVFLINGYVNGAMRYQDQRNLQLSKEVNILNHEVGKINGLIKLRKRLISNITQSQVLQQSRSLTVHLFDELVKIIPEQVYLNGAQRIGARIELSGRAQSNHAVSQLMRNMEVNPWFQRPILTEIKNLNDISTEGGYQFKLNFVMKAMDSE